jgi:hypothetical protein
MSWLKTVIHVHTSYSHDADVTPAQVIETARQQGVDCLAITDHDEIAGALEARQIGGVQVIVGQEISSADGHVIGLFLQEQVPPGLSAEQTAERIRAQGGLVLAPHPFTILCPESLQSAIGRLLPWLDAVEVCNAQDFLPWENTRARRFAQRHGITPYVGSDSHLRGHLAAAHQLIPAFDGAAGFLDALRRAELHPGCFGPGYFAVMGIRQAREKLLGRQPRPGGVAASWGP